jgi:hypothetical protein
MIKVIKDFYIEVNVSKGVTNYIVRRGDGKKDKWGAFIDKPLAFCGTLGSALDFIRKQNIAESLQGVSCDLQEALRAVETANTTFTEMLKRGGLM